MKWAAPLAVGVLALVLWQALVKAFDVPHYLVPSPLLVAQMNVDRGSDAASMLRKADYVRLIEFAPTYEAKRNRTAQELFAVGSAELISGRYDGARRHLRHVVEGGPNRIEHDHTV